MTALELRDLAREIAAEVATADERAGEWGWQLWSEITLTGNTEPLMSMASFGWWHYKTSLALRVDGEIVAMEEREGTMESPNYGSPRSLGLASDELLFYPDVLRWEVRRQVDEAPARRMIDEYRVPAEFASPRGQALRDRLEAIRVEQPQPELLVGQPRSQAHAAQAPKQRKGWLGRLRG